MLLYKSHRFISGLPMLLLFSSCANTRTILRSPQTNQQNAYHAMPTLEDERKTAHYVSGTLTIGGMNDFLRDDIYIFQGRWHVAHQLGTNLQGYFGLNGSAGVYKISSHSWYGYYDPLNGSITTYEGPKGNKGTSSLGSTAGLAYAIPLGTKAEWRILGVEGSAGQEFGSYYKLRKSLPDTLVSLTDRRNFHATLGGFTEFIFKPRNRDIRIGYQLAVGSSLHRLRNHYDGWHDFTPYYINNTFHFTVRRTTGSLRIASGKYFAGVQMGFSYRLSQ